MSDPDSMPPDPFGTPDAQEVFEDVTTPEQRLALIRGESIEVVMTREQARILQDDPLRRAFSEVSAAFAAALDEEMGGVCLPCGGSGWDDGADEPCFSCGGSGWDA